jgi:nicotinamide riboside kinase
MLVAISGPASSGKTTLLDDLRQPIKTIVGNIPVVWQQERARLVYEVVYASKYDSFSDLLANAALDYQISLAEAFAADVAEVKANPEKIYIADRSGFDVAVYTMLIGGKGEEDAKKIERVFDLIHGSIHGVDMMFLTGPLPSGLMEDGFRPCQYSDPATRSMEVSIFRHLALMHANCIQLPPDRYERVQLISSNISRLIQKG